MLPLNSNRIHVQTRTTDIIEHLIVFCRLFQSSKGVVHDAHNIPILNHSIIISGIVYTFVFNASFVRICLNSKTLNIMCKLSKLLRFNQHNYGAVYYKRILHFYCIFA